MPDAAAPTRTKTGCQNCRVRHVKCDDKQPSCSRCAHSGLDCIRQLNVRFCHNLNPTIATEKGPEDFFQDSQTWVSTEGELSYVDETRDIVAIYETNNTSSIFDRRQISRTNVGTAALSQSAGMSKAPAEIPTFSQPAESPASLLVPQTSLDSPGLTFSSFGDYATPIVTPDIAAHDPSPRSTTGIDTLLAAAERRDRRDTFSSGFSFESPITYPEVRAGGTLSDPSEAKLLRHWVEKLASSFDLTDPLCYFRTVIPQRALNEPVLLNAIFAASARHLSRVDKSVDPYLSDRYHQQCIELLIPMLNDDSAALNENLLASTVILRYLDETDASVSEHVTLDNSGHLIGIHTLIIAQESSAVLGGIRQAAFWVGLRQGIYLAFVKQQSIIPPLQHCNVDRSFTSADEATWANRIIVKCAEVIRYCFTQDEHERTPARYLELRQYCEDWLKCTPPSYNPIYYQDMNETNVFPEIMYLSDATVTGIQHYHLTFILLRAHDPTIPRLGPRRLAALKRMDNEIKHHVKMLCGLALSNRSTPPNFVTASMAVAMAGDKFTDRKEQEACLRVLEICEEDTGMRTKGFQVDLKEAWGWF